MFAPPAKGASQVAAAASASKQPARSTLMGPAGAPHGQSPPPVLPCQHAQEAAARRGGRSSTTPSKSVPPCPRPPHRLSRRFIGGPGEKRVPLQWPRSSPIDERGESRAAVSPERNGKKKTPARPERAWMAGRRNTSLPGPGLSPPGSRGKCLDRRTASARRNPSATRREQRLRARLAAGALPLLVTEWPRALPRGRTRAEEKNE